MVLSRQNHPKTKKDTTMSTELLTRNITERDDTEHLPIREPAALVIRELGRRGWNGAKSLSTLGENAGSKEEDWQYQLMRVPIKNYLENNGLNSPEEDVKAKSILNKHGVTPANTSLYFDSPFEASQMIAAYEVTRPKEAIRSR